MGILFRKASRLFLFFLLTFRVAGELQAQTPAQCGGYALRLREDPSRVGYFISELPLFLNAESITLAAWVRPTAEASDRNEMGIIYRKFYVASMQRGWVEYGLVINSKGEFMFRGLFAKTDGEAQSENTPTRLDSLTSGVVPEKGKWYHVAVTVDHLSKACTFYINGRLVANKTMDGPLRWRMAVGGNYDPMTIGATSISNGTFFSAANYFQGYLDDVLVSSKALTLAQILTIATSGPDKDFADEDFGLEVFYRFLEGSGTSTQSTPYVHSTVGYGFTAVARGLVAWIRFTCDNRPPIAHAGPNKTLVLPENRWTLDGSASSDPDGTIKSYSWQFLNGPTNPKIINSHTPKPEVSGLEEGVYAFQLTVTDDKGATGVAVVTITVENVLKVLLVNATQLVAPSPNPNGFLVSNFSKIDRDQQLQGVATDGVSRVVLLIETKKKIRFTIDEYDASKGSLAPFQDQQVRTSVQEGETQNGVTAVIYTAPDGYGDQYSLRGGRMVTITATEVENPSKKYKAQIRLMTPPIVMVHGMWSAPYSAWQESNFRAALEKVGFSNIQLADYKEDAFRTFDPEDKEGLPARSAIFKAVLDGIKKYKSEGILAAQADFVCHSLGGLHTKAFAQQFFNKANNNFNQGYVHKLVTLGTPHKGSPLGPLLYNMEDYVHLYGSLSGSTLLTLVPLNWILEWGGLPVGTVHRDFETNVSRNPALQRLDASNKHGIKKAHAIIGIAAKDDYQPMERLSQLLFRKGLTALFLTDQHDLIVGKNSQTGGLTSSLQVTYFTSTAHSNPPGLESLGFHTETTNPSIHNKVAALLQSADPGFFAPGFPAPSAIRDGRIMNEKAENNPAFEGSPGQRVQTRKDSVAIRLTPASRNVLVKADARHFEITLEPINGAVIKDPLVLMGAIGWIAMPQKAPYTVQVTLPETTKLVGRVPFCVLARDSSGVFLADTSSLDIEPPGAFYKLEVYPETISLDSLFRRASVQPAAWFIIGQDTVRYALDPAVGVTYSSLNSRVMVKGNGVVEGLQPGTDSIKVTYGGKTVYVPVSIDGNFTANDQLPNSVAIDLADKEVGDNPFVLQGRAVSGGTVAYKLIKGPVALQNDVAIIKGPGKVTLEASAKGDAYFRDAPAVQASFCINPAQPVAIQGDTTTCTGEKAYLLRRDPGTVYHWKIEGGALLRQRGDTAYINWTSPGSHQISVVAQVDGCTGKAREQVITVTTPASLPPLTTLGKPELCSGSSLALSASVTGKVQWFRNDTLVLGTEEPTLVVRKGGAYRVKAANKGCQASSPALVVNELAVPAVQIQVSGNTTLCAGDQVALMATQGAGYQWIKDNALVPLENTQSLSVGTAGRYRAIVAFANGCADTSAAVQVQVNQPPPVPSIYSEGAPTLCAGEVRVLTSSAGKGNQWYKDGILLPGATSQHFSVDKTGNYSLSVQADGCSSALSSVFQVEVIPLPAAPSIALQGKPILCPGGSLELTSSIEENEWLLNGVRIPGANGPELQVKNPGTYTAITVQKGCRSLPSKAVVIEAGSIPSGSIVAPTTLLCPGGAVPLKASGGQSYQWYLGQSPIPGARSADYQATKPGLYSVELSGENGCNAKAQNSITLTEAVKPDVAFDYKPVCQGLPLQFNNTSNTTTGVTWHWDFGDQTTPSQVAAPTHTFSKAGIFRVRLTATVESCTNLQETAEKLVTVEEPAMAVRYPTLFAVRGKSYPLSARPLGVAYHWRPAIEVSDPFSRTPVLTPTAERRYTVRITTVSGCTINDTLEVKLITKSEVFVPKAFSPDGNGSNDRLRPILLGIEEIRSFRVFNRWGQLVYQTQKVGEGWDGTIRGVRQPSEAYTWVFEGIDGDGKPVKASGKSLLIR